MSSSTTGDARTYLEGLSEDRKQMVAAIRDVVLEHLDDGFEEAVDYGMLVYQVPLERYPDTYNDKPLMYAAIASQKRHVSVYLMCVYSDPEVEEWFQQEYERAGKRLDMGKSCVRFRKLDDIPLDLIGQAIARETPDSFIQMYERARSRSGKSG